MTTDKSETAVNPGFEELPKAQLIQAAIRATASSMPASQQTALSDFLASYYGAVPSSDLNRYTASELNRAAEQHWQLCQQRDSSESLLQVINPTQDSHGWDSPHTIIQLVIADQAHLLSSLRSQLLKLGHSVHSVIHPIFAIKRSGGKLISAALLDSSSSADAESVIRLDIDRLPSQSLPILQQQLTALLNSLQQWQAVHPQLVSHIETLAKNTSSDNHRSILQWLAPHRFACFGIAQFELQTPDAPIETLGLLDEQHANPTWQLNDLLSFDNIDALKQGSDDFILCKAAAKAPLIRNEQADLVLLLDNSGSKPSCICIAGLLLSRSASDAIENLAPLKQRISDALAKTHTTADSHDGKALSDVLHGLPRNMLLQSQPAALQEMAEGIVALQERQQIKLFSSVDPLQRFCNCLVYIPRDTYSRELRLSIESILISHIDGISNEFQMHFSSESALARLHFIIEKRPPLKRNIDWRTIEKLVQQAAISWEDQLLSQLQSQVENTKALALFSQYRNAFPASYKEDYSAVSAVADILFIDKQKTDSPQMGFYRQMLADKGIINFKLFANQQSVSLSSAMPIIENFGLRVEAEHPFEIKREEDSTIWIHEFTVEHVGGQALEPETAAVYIEEAFSHVWQDTVENDGFNQLILAAGLNWRQVVILRSYCRYLLQIAVPFSQEYMIDSLVANPTKQHLTTSLASMKIVSYVHF